MLTWTRQTRTPVGRIHVGITSVVYGSIGLATRTIGRTAGGLGRIEASPHTLAGRTLAPRLTALRRDVEGSRRGRRLRSAVNGLIGDVLRDQDSPMAIKASVRHPARARRRRHR